MTQDWLTTLVLSLMTLVGAGATAAAFYRVRKKENEQPSLQWRMLLMVVGTVLAGGLLLYRQRTVDNWHPLVSHLDGLITLALVLGVTIVYLQAGRRLPGFAATLTPMWTLLTGWGICASAWTWRTPWHMTFWDVLHTMSVYAGMFFVVLAAGAGTLFLYVESRLKHHQGRVGTKPLASLESLERVMINAATGGFVLLTLGLVTGVLRLRASDTAMGPGWWYSPKILLGFAAWVVFALLMNVRFNSHFRGARAAWLSIVGLVLLIATFGAVTMVGGHGSSNAPAAPAQSSDTSMHLVEVTPCA